MNETAPLASTPMASSSGSSPPTATQILQGILTRLDTTTSDPMWLTDEILLAILAMDDVPPAPPHDPAPCATDAPTYQDIVAATCMGSMMTKLTFLRSPKSHGMTDAEIIGTLGDQIRNFGVVASYAAVVMEEQRKMGWHQENGTETS